MTNVEVLWAKKNENSGIFKWLPLSVHLKDTESVIGWLFDHWLSSSQRVYLSSQINSDNEEDVRNVLRFLGAVHDIGKATPAFQIQKGYEMIITGERRDEGGMRSVPRKDNTSLCFTETSSGQFRLRPLYYVSDKDKAWYKEHYNIKYSDAYEVYGLTRTGCCGCPISYKAIDDLEKIKPYEPNVVKAAWNIFGKSYLYRQKYNEYKRQRMKSEKQLKGQLSLFKET